MNINQLLENRVLIEAFFKQVDELYEVRKYGNQLVQRLNDADTNMHQLQQEKRALTNFIMDNVPLEKQKEIFNDSSDSEESAVYRK